ncbi:unnamed protein product [Plutella xylostella]|uniref:(diamondback moth) hypothetical protein n=1 Tax=Plutella xylostella TaxID=51655 RepID=A0A8S4EWH3_PLUXY|nr:unnamed protein product [Plutella xylostella]
MSKIPIDKNGLIRNKETRGMFYSTPNRMNNVGLSPAENNQLNTIKKPVYCTSYASLIPKMKEDMDEVTKQNPRILDLRLKLNEISKKQDRSVDKETKSLINGITQRLEEKEQDESGPYSLIFELQNNASTSQHEDKDCIDGNVWTKSDNDAFNGKETSAHCYADSESLKNIVDRLPNVIRIDDKPMKEFEYSCETESNLPVKKPYHTQSRSELCLNFKSYASPRPFDPNASPNENSISRANEENSLDDSLGILTPDQMDDICFLENAFSPTVEGLPSFCDKNDSKASPDTGDTPSTDKTESHSAASTIQNDGFDNNECMNSGFPEEAIIPSVTLQMEDDETQVVFIKASIQKSIPTVDNNEDITDKNAIEPIKEEVLPSFMEDDFMPSIHSSILEPASSIAETTVNLDLPLDCKTNDIRLSVSPQRIEQTPSPEDLPLDSCDIQTEVSTYSNSQYSVSILQDSQTFSDVKNDFPKSMETSKVSNSFITSITSITSLDGYQGDGEMSRPVSRGADHSIGAREEVAEMDWQNVPVTRRADPMTDSDFFTESDADGLDDNVQRGDRRAQVIDGALYGGKNGNGNPPLIVNRSEDSCMESSGVYTDFETHRTSPIFLNVIDDMSPEGSTPSTHSECSQKNVNTSQTLPGFLPALDETLKGKYSPKLSEDTPKSGSKRNSINSEKDSKFNDKLPKEEKRFTLKKYKMPKRDVPSKLKTMLNSRKNDADSSLQSSPKVLKKNERRESLSKKSSIEAKNDFKTKSFKDVKSKVDCSFSLQRSQTTCSVTRMLSSKSSTNAKPKSRHMRMRMELGSAHGSGKSSLHSSQSDLSASSTPLSKVPTNRFPLLMHNAPKIQQSCIRSSRVASGDGARKSSRLAWQLASLAFPPEVAVAPRPRPRQLPDRRERRAPPDHAARCHKLTSRVHREKSMGHTTLPH